MMNYFRHLFPILFLLCSVNASAGPKLLNVAFFDFSKTELGTKSFKAMRDN